ncbi:UDP-N-acetylmuramoyl-L-alanyl-D-glutamate--2,6-diaminopimelate ligase [Companilactobacillus alimentarius]|uniref:UDP-N-acetylmuramyl-tripeptide synthetase n=1 Tax=Companilactobacillus alimentarius DSM 20249 TaxID=1423720 RepID=A0A2K9HHU4_9LACO|nr:UDP-N-acetylmuramoyl-L-alanyl-D-glutamate--2,6-diaminopimelate ligase [Companilactobacillus alimentarius]AUI72120.1 UDP-N-acetylmuramoyl-L-alanyl-D-glutamate--2,6-diaminopimelate ligase [Companilactobacillus alimentarius DSM 20249]KRK78078.1 UDP-N-acetylmuramoylalanyl-D-glutamate--2,6-diaminopimelate ligase [Companilactobacillus alimentarius DSM 20249]GEO44898.1 UDP-N-acetylmuramyl-tripeptide synthetase [Companilactobacillus alimentarius]
MSLKVSKAIEILKKDDLLVSDSVSDENLEVTSISYDSRKDQTNGIFFCKGNQFKAEYLDQAIKNGAKIYVSEKEYSQDIDRIIVKDASKALALLSSEFYGNPQNDLYIVAFTGTKGKTTTSYFTYDILNSAYPKKVALFSTVDRIVGPKPSDEFKSDLTTPESLELFHDMRTAVDNGMKYLVMEVSSQAYKKNRVYGLKFNIGGFLNITPDHIGPNEHPTYADYLNCKKQLMVNSKINIINRQTNDYDTVYAAAKQTSPDKDIYRFAKNEVGDTDFSIRNKESNLNDSVFTYTAESDKAEDLQDHGEYTYELGLVGDFNELNAGAAITAAKIMGIDNSVIADSLKKAFVPGRMEHINTKNHGTIFVDYAHNYASMNALLSFLKREYPDSKIKVVVGSPGDKGVDRRSGFAKVLTELADSAILTTDDPGFEDPAKICKEIDDQIDHEKVEVKTVLDRQEAIREMIESSNNDDIVVLAAKGNDAYQKTKGIDVPYPSDPVVAKKILKDIEG